jgi:hypothetical protein
VTLTARWSVVSMTDLTVPVARALLPEWRLALAAERKSPKTITLYLDSVGRYLTWVETQDLPPMRRTTLQTWITDMLCLGRSPSTARIRQQAVRRYAAGLLAVGHLDTAPFQGMKSPSSTSPSSNHSRSTKSGHSCTPAARTARQTPSNRGRCGTSATKRSSGSWSRPESGSAKSSPSPPKT